MSRSENKIILSIYSPGITVLEGDTNEDEIEVEELPDDCRPGDGVCCNNDAIIGKPWLEEGGGVVFPAGTRVELIVGVCCCC